MTNISLVDFYGSWLINFIYTVWFMTRHAKPFLVFFIRKLLNKLSFRLNVISSPRFPARKLNLLLFRRMTAKPKINNIIFCVLLSPSDTYVPERFLWFLCANSGTLQPPLLLLLDRERGNAYALHTWLGAYANAWPWHSISHATVPAIFVSDPWTWL